MKQLLILISAFFLFQTTIYSQNEQFKEVRIFIRNNDQVQKLIDNGVFIEHFIQREPNSIDVELSTTEIDILSKQNIDFIILDKPQPVKLKNTQTIYEGTPDTNSICGLVNYAYGSMGLCHTYMEIIEQLDSMKSKYPDLISSKDSIGTSLEGRAIYAVKISDNSNIDESDLEGVVYFDGMHHANEPMSMETLLYYMWWLLENYNSNAEATNIVNKTELHFIPIVNPDGYIYNQEIAPDGGGQWRRNRRYFSDSALVGVDLNRNYETGFGNQNWSGNVITVYGEKAFSEPETRAVRDYLIKVNPKIAFSCHSQGQKIIHAPGCEGLPKESDRYAEFSSEFINESFVGYGISSDMLNYSACGSAKDYMYEHGIYGWTIEIGLSKWPIERTFCSTVQNILGPMKYISHIAGSYTRLNDFEVLNIGGVRANDTLHIKLRIKNRGLGFNAEDIAINICTESTNCNALKSSSFIQQLAPGAFAEEEFSFLVSKEANSLDTISLQIEIKESDFVTYEGIKKVLVGKTNQIYFENFESDSVYGINAGWKTTTQDSQSGFQSLVDSKSKSYSPNETSFLILDSAINLKGTNYPMATFNAKWSFAFSDGAQLAVSTNKEDWKVLTIFKNHQYWTQQIIDLSDYRDEIISLRFKLFSDAIVQSDGLYIDDFTIVDYIDAVNTASVSQLPNNMGIKVFPNPTNGIINIVKINALSAKIEVFSYTGQLVFSDIFEDYFYTFNLYNKGTGIYIIRIKDSENISTFKIFCK